MKRNHKQIIVFLSLLVLMFCGVFFSKISFSMSKPTPNPMALTMEDILNLIYDNNLGDNSLQPQLTYWVVGDCPDCRVLRVEGIVRAGNVTYLAIFDLRNGSLNLTPADDVKLEEYLSFFEKNGGKVIPCNSTVKSSFGEGIKLKNETGICVIPAVIGTEDGDRT